MVDQETHIFERILLHPYGIVDAMIYETLVERSAIELFKVTRKPLTSTSARYLVRLTKSLETGVVAEILIRMASEQRTLAVFSCPPSIPTEEASIFKSALHGIIRDHLFLEQRRLDRMIQERERQEEDQTDTLQRENGDETAAALAKIAASPAPYKRGRHESYEEDDWAWEQVNIKKRPRLEVRKEWMERLSPGRDLVDPPGSFRHAISRRRKPKRDSGT